MSCANCSDNSLCTRVAPGAAAYYCRCAPGYAGRYCDRCEIAGLRYPSCITTADNLGIAGFDVLNKNRVVRFSVLGLPHV